MAIPPELRPLIAQVRERMPELAQLPDEQEAEMIVQAMAA